MPQQMSSPSRVRPPTPSTTKERPKYPQDNSMPALEALQAEGYTHCKWEMVNEGTTDICRTLNGQEFEIGALISGARRYNAPIYQTSHVGCQCHLNCYRKISSAVNVAPVEGGDVATQEIEEERADPNFKVQVVSAAGNLTRFPGIQVERR